MITDPTPAYEIAAQHQTAFYGLLAAEKLELSLDPALTGAADPTDWEEAAFMQQDLVQAAFALLEGGERGHATTFFVALGRSLPEDDLSRLGLTIEPFGGGAIAVRETPAILGEVNAKAMLLDILDELADQGESQSVQARIEAILSRVACHGSIRSGRWMRAEEMNALLREMEATPHSGQCNHGRPTYVELKLADIERLFGRT